MTMTMTHQTARIAFQIVILDESAGLALSLVFLTGLFSKIAWLATTTSFLIQDATEAATFTGKVFSICAISLAWGIGVTL